MNLTGTLIEAKESLMKNPKADTLFRLLRDKEKSGAYFWWFVKEGCAPEEIREGLIVLQDAGLIKEKDGSSYDPSDVYYELTDLAYKVRQIYP
jgi:hypothetical protein